MTKHHQIPSDIDYPRDRKFGRASDRMAPLNMFQFVGFLAVMVIGMVLVGCGAVMAAIIAVPLDA